MNPVGLILNEFLCCIVNIHVLYKYEIDLIAIEKCYCDVALFLWTTRVNAMSIGKGWGPEG